MRISRAAIAATVLVGATAVGFGLSIGTASADSDEKLPITSFGDIAVDAVHKRVFISDPTAGKIVATNYQGHETTEVNGLAGVNGLLLSADSSVLYAAVNGTHEIVALSTDTLTRSAAYPVGGSVSVSDVVGPINGKLWFSTETISSGTIGSVDLATAQVKVHDPRTADNLWISGTPAISTGAGAPNLIVLTNVESTRGDNVVYDVSSGTAELRMKSAVNGIITADTAFSADGTHLIQVSYIGANHIALADGVPVQAYPNLRYFDNVELASDNRVAFSYGNAATNRVADVEVFQPGATTPELTFTLPEPAGTFRPEIVQRGLVWEPGGSRIFAVAYNYYLKTYYLYTLNDSDPVEPDPSPTPSPTPTIVHPAFIQLEGPLEAPWGTPVKLLGQFANERPGPYTLTVTRQGGDTPDPVALKDVRTDENGFFTVVDTPPFGGENVYTVSYAGDAYTGPGFVRRMVVSTRVAPSLVLSRSPSAASHAYGSTVNVTATLGKTYQNRVVELWADPEGSEPSRLLKRAAVNSAGKITASVKLTRNTMVSARFNSDLWSNGTVSRMNVWTGVSASTTLTRHYKTKKIGSTTYQFFRKSKNPLISQTMTPYPGRKVRTIIQVWSGGKWTLWSGRYTKLSSTGKASFTFVTGAKVGKKFRVRAEYLRGTSGDSVNYNSAGAWKYFTYTN